MTDNNGLICPGCGKYISDYLEECPHCHLKNPVRKSQLTKLLFPLKNDIKRVIIGANIVLLVAAYIIPFLLPIAAPNGRDFLGLIPSPSSVSLNLLGWADIRLVLAGKWWVLITAAFLHGGLLHILFNMLWIRDLAPSVNSIFSPFGLIIIYIFSGALGNLVAIFTPVVMNLLFTADSSYAPVIGASGAVFGLMGSMVAFGRKKGGFFGRQMARQLGMWAAIMIVFGFLMPGISNAAHIGGFVGGFITGKILPTGSPASQRGWVFWAAVFTFAITILSFVLMIIRLITILGSI